MTSTQLAFVFPGQGSQSVGMLADLASADPVVQATFAEASEGAGVDLWRLSQEGPDTELNTTEFTQPALLAYRRAAELDPTGAGPGYFLGFALIRQGRLMDARGVWASTLETASEDAAGREGLEESLARLDALIANQGVVPR